MTTQKNHVSVLPGKSACFRRYPASAQLKGLVDTYWSLEVTEPPFTVNVVPDGMVDITLEPLRRPIPTITWFICWVRVSVPGARIRCSE